MRTKEIRIINRFLVHLRNQHSETLSSSLFIIFLKTHHHSIYRSHNITRIYSCIHVCEIEFELLVRAKEEITWNEEIFDGTLTVRFPFHRIFTFNQNHFWLFGNVLMKNNHRTHTYITL